MKNSKKLFLIVLSVLTVAFISCKDKGTDPKQLFKHSDLVGTWTYYIQEYDYTYAFTIDQSGLLKYGAILNGEFSWSEGPDTQANLPGWDANKEVEEYPATINLVNTEYKLNFTSKNSCSVSYTDEGVDYNPTFTKQ